MNHVLTGTLAILLIFSFMLGTLVAAVVFQSELKALASIGPAILLIQNVFLFTLAYRIAMTMCANKGGHDD